MGVKLKRIFIDYNASDNFGDDLLVNIVCNAFGKFKFATLIPEDNGKGLENIKNLKILDIFPKTAGKTYKKVISKSKACFSLGSGQFFETDAYMNIFWEFKRLLQTKPMYSLSANLGEYKNQYFIEELEDFVSKCNGVWFRDKHYCRLVKNTEYMPDMLFLTEFPKPKKAENPYAVISIANFSLRENIMVIRDKYIEFIVNISESLKDLGYETVFLGLNGKDEDKELLKKLSVLGRPIIYDGTNMNKILSWIAGAACVFGSENYDIIPALAAKKKIMPIVVDDEMERLIEDIDKELPVANLKTDDSVSRGKVAEALNYNLKADIDSYKAEINNVLSQIEEQIINL